jgi:hypothetical protein
MITISVSQNDMPPKQSRAKVKAGVKTPRATCDPDRRPGAVSGEPAAIDDQDAEEARRLKRVLKSRLHDLRQRAKTKPQELRALQSR